MRNLDLSSWNGLLSTLLGLVLVTLIAVGMRMLVMQTIQRRQQRENRQINERLRTLIAAYKTLGGSFTGDLSVDPAHLRDRRRLAREAVAREAGPAVTEAEARDGGVDLAVPSGEGAAATDGEEGSERRRRIRDAVEAALSDIILLGTEDQVRLAAQAASEMVAGRPVHMAALVVSLRQFIRQALDLDAIPADVSIPEQGPLRTAGGGKGGGGGEGGRGGGGAGGGGGGGGMGGGMAMGAGGMGAGMGLGRLGQGDPLEEPDRG